MLFEAKLESFSYQAKRDGKPFSPKFSLIVYPLHLSRLKPKMWMSRIFIRCHSSLVAAGGLHHKLSMGEASNETRETDSSSSRQSSFFWNRRKHRIAT
jgi:hypothetical protein